ncbi:MAG: UDP-N-acetylglucosamine--N-acetylmuramyl-(pentapeptide) pyrophosphoryl-undecaprenol N-acetylglucosamine transferase [bacterium]|nr:UDP-N-acetylglucosamine--N-acetylmuramyl-(pentapeptide) pyrophosphoryl-undecaprenol N-acetylglucosamine transferase [Candidatus Sumerlaeota bacterium]
MKLLIAAGGTGGHIIPAIALGEALRQHHPGAPIRYLCGEREIELRLYADNGIEPIVLPARQLGSGLAAHAIGLAAALANTARAAALIRREHFDTVIGMGGYVSGPAVAAAVMLRRASAIHEANSIPGKTNRLLAPFVDLCAINFPMTAGMLRSRKILRTGLPMRGDIDKGARDDAMKHFALDPRKRTLLVMGGSQGARYLYRTIMQTLPALDIHAHADVQVLWSTGRTNHEELTEELAKTDLEYLSVRLEPFIERMDLALAAADTALARAGAGAIAEMLACGVYALYIPLPSAIYDHQTQNAREVAAAGAGEAIPENSFTVRRAAVAIASLLSRTELGWRITNPPELDSRNSAKTLADALCALSA